MFGNDVILALPPGLKIYSNIWNILLNLKRLGMLLLRIGYASKAPELSY